ncbi:glycosyltransferase family 2 protein [Microbacterium sp. DT81.1]|uniref:glycosyltransferase family 2 protein n=1 Tax=Microbacterium sp. DT81.1 TaxID=3393413 RepID=UPI003CF80390
MTIDICMPYWGDPGELRVAVESVLSQDDPDWRLVVIDDCYPDDSVPAYFAGLRDARVTYTRNERNVGITENFRRAVAAARSTHVVILGSDDILHPTYVSRMRSTAAAHPDVDVFQLGVEVIDGEGGARRSLADEVKLRLLTPRSAKTLRGEDMARSLLVGDWLYWPSLLFRTARLREIDFRDDLPIILDLALLIDIAFAGGALHYEPGVVFSYRRHNESLSQKTILDGTRFDDERAYYRATAALAASRGWHRARRAARLRIMSRLHGLAVLPAVLRRGTPAARRAALALAFR